MAARTSRRPAHDADKPVRDTDLDAALARFSAVSKNYLHELSLSAPPPFARPETDGAVPSDYAALFVPASLSSRERARPPWVNIGTHQRTYIIDELVERFLLGTATEGPQVVSLGAGSDSRFWRLRSRLAARWPPLARWVETDLEPTVRQKIRTIAAHDSLRGLCGRCSPDPSAPTTPPPDGRPDGAPTELHGAHYTLLAADLRRPAELVAKLSASAPTADAAPVLRASAPTLILAELVFLYLSPAHTAACLEALTRFFAGPLMIVCFEALNLDDSFSRIMGRGLSLAGFDYNCSVDSQIARFRAHGFTEIVSTDMKALRLESAGPAAADGQEQDQWSTRWSAELARIRRLEFLDEVEELELILLHYSLSWARRNFSSPNRETVGFYLPQF
ncbi:hypothetical protein PtA15_4A612 [Puccinia triticina]|uniref:Leucine carboxyl methyltransferase 1 n=1 Tax=Puccinia triticina TaxID=208348 RepID=A0ABY7CGE8_9BASI|nr:uncharacterized protein PtA15_4A612 [Puccinia triticina]WAQ84160.1 hypothetical protein PtA15_4A612 [Puccinia triticina]